jgi:hypothetical protein
VRCLEREEFEDEDEDEEEDALTGLWQVEVEDAAVTGSCALFRA